VIVDVKNWLAIETSRGGEDRARTPTKAEIAIELRGRLKLQQQLAHQVGKRRRDQTATTWFIKGRKVVERRVHPVPVITPTDLQWTFRGEWAVKEKGRGVHKSGRVRGIWIKEKARVKGRKEVATWNFPGSRRKKD